MFFKSVNFTVFEVLPFLQAGIDDHLNANGRINLLTFYCNPANPPEIYIDK